MDSVAAIPVWVITGALGAGKTTTIARLMARKPPAQNWIVILNEFTESGIDALTVAGTARGAYDVRLIPGGCLCCAGELDFARQLRELTRTTRPDRIIIEPSGIGHPAAITEELLQHQAHGTLLVESIVCVVDPRRVAQLLEEESVERAQAEVADALVLAKADLATDQQRADFSRIAGAFFPPKKWAGEMRHGDLPEPALANHSGRARSSQPRTGVHVEPADHADHTAKTADTAIQIGAFAALRSQRRHVGREALAWTIAREAVFARTRLRRVLQSLGGVERLKGVFRTGPETWLLVQMAGTDLTVAESAWRRDSRVEALYSEGARVDAAALELALAAALAR